MRGRALILFAGALVASAFAAPASHAAPAKTRVEHTVASISPDARRVKETYVRLYAPLPASAPAHPAACDWIGYLRFRDPRGPKKSPNADAVAVLMPGFL